jgi:hypothetical protein
MLATALFAGCGTWIGISVGSPTLIGKTEDASLSLLAVRYARAVLQRPDFSQIVNRPTIRQLGVF